MKRKLLLIVAVAITSVVTIMAQTPIVMHKGESLKLNQPVPAETFAGIEPMQDSAFGPMKAESANTVNLTVTVDVDNAEWNPSYSLFTNYIILSNNDHRYLTPMTFNSILNKWNTDYEIEAEPGTYDLILWMTRFNTLYYIDKQVFVVHEDIDISEENSTLNIGPSEAIQCVHFESYYPNGEKVELPTWKWNDDAGYWNFDVVEEGNSDTMFIMSLFADTKYGFLTYSGTSVAYQDADTGWSQADCFDFWINPEISDNYHMVQLRRWSKDDVNCLTHTGTQGLTLTNVTNQPKDFIAYNDEFSPSKYESEEKGYNWEARITYMLNGSSLVQIAPQFPSSGIVHYLYSQPDLTNDLGFDVSFALGHTEISDLIDYGFYSDYLTYSTYALPVLLSTLDEDPFYYNSLYTCGENISFRYNEEQYYKEMDYHKRFSFTKAEKGDNVWGNSTPVLAFMNQVYDASWADKPINYMNTDYFGRLGEMHKADNYLVDWSVYIDDELWYDASNTALGSWTYDFIYQDYEPASIDVHLENTNVLVDGIDGHNIADIHQEWSLPESDDHIAPTLQMLMMRDSEDNITDRFKKAEDGFMEFCGADFQYYYSEEPWLFYFYEQPMEVTVEYAPYGSTEWEEVTGTEVIDEYFQMPTFGYFYRTPLASVDRKSANGWFDLRFTLTDAAGNKQVQELSPAFHIDELSGLNSINASSADVVKVEYYDLQGRKVSNPNAGLYIKISTKADGSSTTQKVALN